MLRLHACIGLWQSETGYMFNLKSVMAEPQPNQNTEETTRGLVIYYGRTARPIVTLVQHRNDRREWETGEKTRFKSPQSA